MTRRSSGFDVTSSSLVNPSQRCRPQCRVKGATLRPLRPPRPQNPRRLLRQLTGLQKRIQDSVVVLDEAYKSAEQTRYRHVERAARCLQAVGDVAAAWHDGSLASSFELAFQERGFDLRAVSSVTHGTRRGDYERTYAGERILLGPHVGIGDGGSAIQIPRCTGASTRRSAGSSWATSDDTFAIHPHEGCNESRPNRTS